MKYPAVYAAKIQKDFDNESFFPYFFEKTHKKEWIKEKTYLKPMQKEGLKGGKNHCDCFKFSRDKSYFSRDGRLIFPRLMVVISGK